VQAGDTESMYKIVNPTYGPGVAAYVEQSLAKYSWAVDRKVGIVWGSERPWAEILLARADHVETTSMHSCASGMSIVHSLTDGHERKQFAHADDIARALVDMMAGFKGLAPVTDVTTGAWMSMRQVAGMVARAAGGSCHVLLASRKRYFMHLSLPRSPSLYE